MKLTMTYTTPKGPRTTVCRVDSREEGELLAATTGAIQFSLMPDGPLLHYPTWLARRRAAQKSAETKAAKTAPPLLSLVSKKEA